MLFLQKDFVLKDSMHIIDLHSLFTRILCTIPAKTFLPGDVVDTDKGSEMLQCPINHLLGLKTLLASDFLLTTSQRVTSL